MLKVTTYLFKDMEVTTIEHSLPVSEQFYSIQGEGRTVGIPAYFLRLKSCNILCGGKGTDKDGQLHNGATWRCDTIEVWLKGKKKSFDQVVKDFGDDFLNNLKSGSHLVVTGGEPLLHQESILEFLLYIKSKISKVPIVEIETNGTLVMDLELVGYVSYINCSPKLSNSGVPYDKRIKIEALNQLASFRQTIFKFVVSSEHDLGETHAIVRGSKISKNQVYLMPAGSDRETLENVDQFVVQACLQKGYKFSPRLHIHIWNKKTGV